MVRYSIGNDFDGQTLGVADRFFASLPVTHHAREFDRFGYPATIVLPIELDCQVHTFSICHTSPPQTADLPQLTSSQTASGRIGK